ncbi:MAG: MFS transporter [Anaerolineales bacterium]|jgi:MFS family permease
MNPPSAENPGSGAAPASVPQSARAGPGGTLQLASASARFRLGQTFASLDHPNYRLWFIGQLASLMGTYMQSTAQGFLAFELTHSTVYLGYVGFATGAPCLFLMLFGGVISDRTSRRNLLIGTQASMMILAFILSILAFTGVVQPWNIVVLAFGLGVANAFDAPTRQGFVLEMVPREDLSNAIALNSAMYNLATVVGPAIGGLTYALFGPGWCFAINGISFLAVIAALTRMRLPPVAAPRSRRSALTDLREGVQYVASNATVLTLIVVCAVTTLVGLTYSTLIPAWSVVVLEGGPATNGWLQSAVGMGALIGALVIASLGRFRFKGRLLTLGTLAFPALIVIFSFTRTLPLSVLAMVGVGLGYVFLFNMLNSLIQHEAPEGLRGRVIAFYSLSFNGILPLGALLSGAAAFALGVQHAVLLSGSLLLAFGVALWFRAPGLRRLE